jgi:hypothetical protein
MRISLDLIINLSMHLFHVFELLFDRVTYFCSKFNILVLHKIKHEILGLLGRKLNSIYVKFEPFNWIKVLKNLISKVWVEVFHSNWKCLFWTLVSRRAHYWWSRIKGLVIRLLKRSPHAITILTSKRVHLVKLIIVHNFGLHAKLPLNWLFCFSKWG